MTCSRDIHHHVSDDTLPHRGDKQDKNRYADGRNVGGLAVVAYYLYYSTILRMGFIGEARFIA